MIALIVPIAVPNFFEFEAYYPGLSKEEIDRDPSIVANICRVNSAEGWPSTVSATASAASAVVVFEASEATRDIILHRLGHAGDMDEKFLPSWVAISATFDEDSGRLAPEWISVRPDTKELPPQREVILARKTSAQLALPKATQCQHEIRASKTEKRQCRNMTKNVTGLCWRHVATCKVTVLSSSPVCPRYILMRHNRPLR